MVKTDFFISPAYWVPMMRTFFSVKFRAMTASLFVPSFSGSREMCEALRISHSGSNVANSSFVGRMRRVLMKRACQARTVWNRAVMR